MATLSVSEPQTPRRRGQAQADLLRPALPPLGHRAHPRPQPRPRPRGLRLHLRQDGERPGRLGVAGRLPRWPRRGLRRGEVGRGGVRVLLRLRPLRQGLDPWDLQLG